MFNYIDSLVKGFENGRLSRRELVARIATCAAIVSGGRTIASGGRPGESTFKARELNHVALNVTDVARSRDFYRNHLDLSVLQEGGNSCFMRVGEHFLALFQSAKPGLDHYCYTIDNYDPATAVEKLKTAGLAPERRESRVYFEDPDGLTVQVAARNDWAGEE
jgi:catechol-2,3-dioxygenase